MAQKQRLKPARKELFFSELHSLLASGIDFSRAFRLLITSEENTMVKSTINDIYQRVVAGASLGSAMQASGAFSALDCGVIRIGEEAGRLDETLMFLSEYYHKKIEQRRIVISSVSYPVIILITALIVVIFMMMVVVPMFEQVYTRMGGELPWLTQQIIALSSMSGVIVSVLGALVLGCGAVIYIYRNNRSFKRISSDILLRTPILGYVYRKSSQANFCKLLYLLSSSGVPLIRSLQLLRNIINFYPYQQSFDQIALAIERGESFASNLEKYPRLYDVRLSTLLLVGEETNRLPEMLLKQGTEITSELEYTLRQIGSMLEPILILFVGTIVAVILIAMYLPMFSLGNVI